jgi:hypothetical protein
MNDALREPGALDVPLSRSQLGLLDVIGDLARANSAWPAVSGIDRAMVKARKRVVVVDELRKMPPGLIYGSRFRHVPSPNDEVRLTIAGFARCTAFTNEVDTFLAALRWCARTERRVDPKSGETDIGVSRRQVARGVGLSVRRDQAALAFLFLLLQAHRWGSNGSGGYPLDEWQLRLGPDVRRFAKVHSVKDYLATYTAWMESLEAFDAPMVVKDEEPMPERGNYVNPLVLGSLRDAATAAALDLSKLIALVQELDGTYQAGFIYAPHAILRAILDHIPPIFGQPNFAAVANNHQWGVTDRKYMRRLEAFREQADDALHRQISRSPDLLRTDDMPPAVWINSLLRGCCHQLVEP